jgi:sodium transport system permease protein
MRWSNIWNIFVHEVRDQIRDRRTLFMIFILPILLYPILGIGMLQFLQAFEQKPRTVVVIGAENLPAEPPLLTPAQNSFVPSLFDSPQEATRLRVRVEPANGPHSRPEAREFAVRSGEVDIIVTIPADLRTQLDRIETEPIPIVYDSTDEQSQTTYLRVREVLARWKERIVSERLKHDQKSESYTEPIKTAPVDVAPAGQQGINVWARLFPFLLVIMALTGAFYPSIDLCAGEKERGTMETLLISPASRAEIVLGKFLTVVLASMMTALLNIVSMGLTGWRLAHTVGGVASASAGHTPTEGFMAPPTVSSAFWMVLLLIPLSVFFSAVCLSLAVLARSMKEGQYYMTPLYLVCLPLILLTMVPGIELNLFYSLVPVTGVALLLRALILGDYRVAAHYFLPVLIPTVLYGLVALRWAVDQFEREDVLFREAERFSLKNWARHLLRDKESTPTAGEAIFCFAIMLTLAWFTMQYLGLEGAANPVRGLAASQLAFILLPPLLMALLLTSHPRRTLRLYWPEWKYLIVGGLLALTLHPLTNELRVVVEDLFPPSETVKKALQQMMQPLNLGTAVVLLALLPAVCEEVAFRGYILSGLERRHRTRSAILLSALLFGFLHVLLSLFQQLFNATLLGIVLGLLAVRSNSIFPGILFHFVNNALALVMGALLAESGREAIVGRLYRNTALGLYHWWIVVLGMIISGLLLVWLWKSHGRAQLWPKQRAVRGMEERAEAVAPGP